MLVVECQTEICICSRNIRYLRKKEIQNVSGIVGVFMPITIKGACCMNNINFFLRKKVR